MKIAIAQLNYTIGDVDGNASKIIDSIHKAKAQHADLVIFAEQAVSGTPAFDLLRGGRHDQRRGADPEPQGAALHRQEIHHGAS